MAGVELPERLFAVGHEPRGERVIPYHKPNQIKTILSTLSEEEVAILRKSTFGKFLSTAEKPSFSGRFVRYIISRQLRAVNPYEIWILFAGKPVRFSLREFAIVTGLPCGEIPRRSTKRKLKLKEEPYWPKLFGTLGSITVEENLTLLDRKSVGDSILRVKYACLALLASVLLPTSLVPKINPCHAELIADLDEFFAYPWGRVAFDMVISSIKERDAVALSQSSFAVKGFIHALQLVIVEAVPSLLEVPQVDSLSYSESEEEDDIGAKRPRQLTNGFGKQCINPAHARTLDEKCLDEVVSIIEVDDGVVIDNSKLTWPKEVADIKVDNLVNLIKDGFEFNKGCFVGGYTTEDVLRLEKVKKEQAAKEKELKARNVKVKDSVMLDGEGSTAGDVGMERLMSVFGDSIKGLLNSLEDKVNHTVCKVEGLETRLDEMKSKVVTSKELGDALQRVESHIVDKMKEKLDAVMKGYQVSGVLKERPRNRELSLSVGNQHHELSPNKSRQESLNENRCRSSASEKTNGKRRSASSEEVDSGEKGDSLRGVPQDNVEGLNQHRAGKRNRNVPVGLITDFECDKRTKQLASESFLSCFGIKGSSDMNTKFKVLCEKLQTLFNKTLPNDTVLSNEDIQEIANRTRVMSTKMVDALTFYTSYALAKCGTEEVRSEVLFLDSKFATHLGKHSSKFVKRKNKSAYKFPEAVVKLFPSVTGSRMRIQRVYFPFCLNKMHWVGVCVDINNADILVFDCNNSYLKMEALARSLKYIAAMFPYVYNQVLGKEVVEEFDNFTVVRCKGVPQNTNNNDSGLTSFFYMWAHSVGGLPGLSNVTPDVVAMESQKVAVAFHEELVAEVEDA